MRERVVHLCLRLQAQAFQSCVSQQMSVQAAEVLCDAITTEGIFSLPFFLPAFVFPSLSVTSISPRAPPCSPAPGGILGTVRKPLACERITITLPWITQRALATVVGREEEIGISHPWKRWSPRSNGPLSARHTALSLSPFFSHSHSLSLTLTLFPLLWNSHIRHDTCQPPSWSSVP